MSTANKIQRMAKQATYGARQLDGSGNARAIGRIVRGQKLHVGHGEVTILNVVGELVLGNGTEHAQSGHNSGDSELHVD